MPESKSASLFVLKSHFDSACITVLKQLLSKSEKNSLAHIGCKRAWASLRFCEAVCVRTVLFVGKCGF